MTAAIISVSALICLIEAIYLIPKGMKKELTAVAIILSIAVFIQISNGYGMDTPIGLIRRLFEPIGKAFFNRL